MTLCHCCQSVSLILCVRAECSSRSQLCGCQRGLNIKKCGYSLLQPMLTTPQAAKYSKKMYLVTLFRPYASFNNFIFTDSLV